MGVGDTNDRDVPTAVTLGSQVRVESLAMGGNHTCVILNDTSLKCWGANDYGQLGLNNTGDRNEPPSAAINLGQGRTARQVAAGKDHTCALLDNHTVKCWGENSLGVLGYEPHSSSRNVPPWGDGINSGPNSHEVPNIDEMGDNLPVVELL